MKFNLKFWEKLKKNKKAEEPVLISDRPTTMEARPEHFGPQNKLPVPETVPAREPDIE